MMLHVIRQAHNQHLTVTDVFRHLAYAKYNYSSQAATSTLTNARKNENIVHKFYKYFSKEEPTVEVKLQTMHLKKPADLLPFTSTESHANEVTAELRGDGCVLENVEKFYEDFNIGEELNHVSNDRSQLSLDRNITTDVQCVVEKVCVTSFIIMHEYNNIVAASIYLILPIRDAICIYAILMEVVF